MYYGTHHDLCKNRWKHRHVWIVYDICLQWELSFMCHFEAFRTYKIHTKCKRTQPEYKLHMFRVVFQNTYFWIITNRKCFSIQHNWHDEVPFFEWRELFRMGSKMKSFRNTTIEEIFFHCAKMCSWTERGWRIEDQTKKLMKMFK